MVFDLFIIDASGNESYRSWQFPENWYDLTKDQWLAAIDLKIMFAAGGYRHERLRNLLCRISAVKDENLLSDISLVDPDVLTGIAESLQWVFIDPIHERSYFTGNLIFRGPDFFLANWYMKQFGLARQCVDAFGAAFVKKRFDKDTNSEVNAELTEEEYAIAARKARAALVDLMCVCFRIKLLPWKSWLCDIYRPLFKILPDKILYRNLYNVWGMMNALKEKYQWVYEGEGDDRAPDHQFRSLLESLAGEKFGDYYRVQKAMLHDVMVHMDHNAYRVYKMNRTQKQE